jgi:hypothetical protein
MVAALLQEQHMHMQHMQRMQESLQQQHKLMAALMGVGGLDSAKDAGQ